ncbi:MAG: hypothetical protein AAGE05_11085 [Pseudomonadota bacterium]
MKISAPRPDAGSRFADRLAACFDGVTVEPPLADCQASIDRDGALLDRVLESGRRGPSIRLWRNRDCLVVPRALTRDPAFARAAETCPLPVVSRASGGTAVIHGPHIANVSIARPVEGHALRRYYGPIVETLLPALRSLGLPVTVGPVAGAHCDGRFNLRIGRRKIGGTAAFVRTRRGQTATLAHASITVEQRHDDLSIIETFEHALGHGRLYDRDAHGSVGAALRGEEVRGEHGAGGGEGDAYWEADGAGTGETGQEWA